MHIIKIYSFGQNIIFSFAGGQTLHLYVLKQINFIHFTCQSDKKKSNLIKKLILVKLDAN